MVYQDGSAHYSRALSDRLVRTATANGIPVQRAVFQQYGSDAAALLKRGVDVSLWRIRRGTLTRRLKWSTNATSISASTWSLRSRQHLPEPPRRYTFQG